MTDKILQDLNKNFSEVKFFKDKRYEDKRGFFAETYNYKKNLTLGIDCKFIQDNQSISFKVGTVRGLHFQSPPFAQSKLVRCGYGRIFDVAVDIRNGSPNFGKWVGYELSAKNGCQLFIPEGFAHGFMTLEPNSEIIYKCSNYYKPESEMIIRWNDPYIGINWPLNQDIIISDKDAEGVFIQNICSPFMWGKK